MAATLSGQFVRVFYNSQDIGIYLDDIKPQRASDPADVTTFASGGGPITVNNIRGTAISDIQISGLYDPTWAKIMRQYFGSRTGYLLQIYAGSNGIPGQGDELFSGYYSPFKVAWPYVPKQVSRLTFDLKIPDGATVVPAFATI